MSNKLELKTEVFINDVVVPFYNGLKHNKSNHIIYDRNGKIITASDSSVERHGYSQLTQIRGKTIEQIYKLGNHCPNYCRDLNIMRQDAIIKKSPIDYLCISEYPCGLLAFTAEQTPIFDPKGDIIATIVVLSEIPCYMSNQNCGLLSKRQAEIVFLLSIGASQKEIASIFDISRGTIAKTIENICIRLEITGCSERNIIEKANELGCARLPKEVVRPGVVQISKLYDNHHILSLFHKHINKHRAPDIGLKLSTSQPGM